MRFEDLEALQEPKLLYALRDMCVMTPEQKAQAKAQREIESSSEAGSPSADVDSPVSTPIAETETPHDISVEKEKTLGKLQKEFAVFLKNRKIPEHKSTPVAQTGRVLEQTLRIDLSEGLTILRTLLLNTRFLTESLKNTPVPTALISGLPIIVEEFFLNKKKDGSFVAIEQLDQLICLHRKLRTAAAAATEMTFAVETRHKLDIKGTVQKTKAAQRMEQQFGSFQTFLHQIIFRYWAALSEQITDALCQLRGHETAAHVLEISKKIEVLLSRWQGHITQLNAQLASLERPTEMAHTTRALSIRIQYSRFTFTWKQTDTFRNLGLFDPKPNCGMSNTGEAFNMSKQVKEESRAAKAGRAFQRT